MQLEFSTYDVFTCDAFAGNPLAVVMEADDVDAPHMQAIAREFGLPETVFVSRERGGVWPIRIFTPALELPFATHPSLGAAAALALRSKPIGQHEIALQTGIGRLDLQVSATDDRHATAYLRAPRLPVRSTPGVALAEAAEALGLQRAEIGFAGHSPRRSTSSTTYDLVPVASLGSLGRAAVEPSSFNRIFGMSDHPAVMVYTQSEKPGTMTFRARMFWPGPGGHLAEDPATASAAATLAGVIVETGGFAGGCGSVMVEQGVEMGRPSRILLEVEVAGGQLTGLRFGGGVVKVSRGELLV